MTYFVTRGKYQLRPWQQCRLSNQKKNRFGELGCHQMTSSRMEKAAVWGRGPKAGLKEEGSVW